MDKITVLKRVDKLARDAHALWNAIESLKMSLAKDSGVSKATMRAQGIYTGEGGIRDSNTEHDG